VWINNLRLSGLILSGYLTVQSILILILIISLKVLSKREEIEIMHLLGASFWFIAKPFLLEGVIYGLMGVIFGFLIAASLLFYATPMIIGWLAEIPLFPVPTIFFGEVLAAEVMAGIILGVIASALGVRRFVHSD